MRHPFIDFRQIGRLIDDPHRRRSWQKFVEALHEAATPGGPLEGWLFHGAAAATAERILCEGMKTTHAVVAHPSKPDRWLDRKGVHWGVPAVAAFYAEDRIESTGDPDLDLAIVGVRLSDLEDLGRLAVDGQTLDCPLASRIGRSETEIYALWDASAKDWRACLDLYGTVVALTPVPARHLRMLKSTEDVLAMIEDVTPTPSVRYS